MIEVLTIITAIKAAQLIERPPGMTCFNLSFSKSETSRIEPLCEPAISWFNPFNRQSCTVCRRLKW